MYAITLFNDQTTLTNSLRQALSKNKYVLMQSATGSGKSVMAADLIASSQSKGKKSAIVVPRIELIGQMSNTFKKFNIPHSFVGQGLPFNPYAKTHICSLQTLVNRLDCIEPDIVFDDEIHFGGKQREKSIEHYKSIGAYMVGLTATPQRGDGKGLGRWYDSMVQGASIKWLIDNGRLSQYRAFAATKPTGLSALRTRAGDYAKDELAELMESDGALIGNAVTEWIRHAAGKKTIAFCVSRKHAKITQERFNAAGISAGYVDGTMNKGERKREIGKFAQGVYDILVSVNLLQFGFDLASCVGYDVVIEAMIDLQPTKSLSMQLQKWGRVLRKKLEAAIIIDCAGNIAEHGLPCDAREWTLADRRKRGKNEGDAEQELAAQSTCKGCKSNFDAKLANCPFCGLAKPPQDRTLDEIDGELQEITPEMLKRERKVEQAKAGTLEDLIALGKQRGMKFPEKWAAYVFTSRQAKRK